jgi:hypothetical protein
MHWTIIVASSDAAQLELLLDSAEEIRRAIGSSARHRIVNAMSIEDVQQLHGLAPDPRTELLIITASLRQQALSRNPQAQPGFDLVRTMQNNQNPPACIVVSDRIEHYRATQTWARCEWLAIDATTNYVEQCLNLAGKLGIVPRRPIFSRRQSLTSSFVPTRIATPNVLETVATPEPGVVGPKSVPTRDWSPCFRAKRYALIEVELYNRAELSTVKLMVNDPEKPVRSRSTPLNLRQSDVDDLVKKSKRLRERLSEALGDSGKWEQYYRKWQVDYKSLGEGVYNLLWSTAFRDYYGIALGSVGQNVCLRFNLEGLVLDGLWEAMFNVMNNRFLMLDNMMTRRTIQTLDTFRGRPGRGRVLNVLVVRSDVPDNSIPKGPKDLLWERYWEDTKLPALTHLDKEVEVLRKLQRHGRSTRAADRSTVHEMRVDVLPHSRSVKPWSLAEVLENRLKNSPRSYDVVHFAGHALFAPGQKSADDRSYLIFSGDPDPRAVTVSEVAQWLEKTSVQLVYLSCCRSGAAQVATEFARNNIPMAIGFNWDLEDSKGVDFAEGFYRELLSGRLKVCRAFHEARLKLHNKHQGGDPIWASAVLVAQPMSWFQVEEVLSPPVRRRAPGARTHQTKSGRRSVGAGANAPRPSPG